MATDVDAGEAAAALQAVTSGLVGFVGVAAQDMAGGAPVFLTGEQAFPMASTYKVPIAMALLTKSMPGN